MIPAFLLGAAFIERGLKRGYFSLLAFAQLLDKLFSGFGQLGIFSKFLA